MTVSVDPALGRGVIVTIPAAAAKRWPRLFNEAHRFADLVLLGREYGVVAGNSAAAWRAADLLAELRAELRRTK